MEPDKSRSEPFDDPLPTGHLEPADMPEDEPERPADDEVIEDDPAFVDASARSLEFDGGPPQAATLLAVEDEAGEADAGAHPSTEAVAIVEGPQEIDPSREVSSHRLIVELKRIEDEVRRILDPKDPRRKRRFTGTRRWNELEEDIHEWRFSDRFDEPTLRELLRLIARRHTLFARLRFLAATRPTWNT